MARGCGGWWPEGDSGFRLTWTTASQNDGSAGSMISGSTTNPSAGKIGREVVWTDIALWASEFFRKGERRLPLPPVDDILASYEGGEWPHRIQAFVDHYTDEQAACHIHRRSISSTSGRSPETFTM